MGDMNTGGSDNTKPEWTLLTCEILKSDGEFQTVRIGLADSKE